MDGIYDEEENDMLEPAAEEQNEQQEDWLEGPDDLPNLDGPGDDDPYDPEAEEVPVQPEPAPPQRETVSDRRAALLALAKKQGAGGDEGSKKRKSKKDKRDKQQEQQGSRPKRMRQQQGAAEPEDGPGSKRPRGYTAEMPEDAYQETADDKNFIDDDGVPEDERYEGDDLEVLARAEEAEEAAPGDEEDGEPLGIVDEVIRSRKRRRKASDEQIDADVHMLVQQMMACAKKDAETMSKKEKKPATAKFQALNNVNELLRQRSHHESFVQQGGLVAMAQWLRPYSNGALPLLDIRSKLVDLLQLMNLDTSNTYTREKLEQSELGKIIMFYEKNPHDKSMALKTKCRDLILEWSAPIFADPDAELRKKRLREREHRQRSGREREERQRIEEREAAQAERRRKAKEGEDGFRTRAAVPQPSRMDFVINPGSRSEDMPRQGIQPGAKSGKPKSPMPEALQKALNSKKRGNKDRFGGMSVEGRGIII